MITSDIFTTITRYDQLENRFTASLVYLIRYLWSNSNNRQRNILCHFLNKLYKATFAPDDDINIVMQKTERDEDENKIIIPDFQISSGSVLVWVEVKDTASLEDDQLNKYKNELLKKEGYKQKTLVLLRHHFISEEDKKDADNDVTWDTLYALLKEVTGAFDEDSIHFYLLSEFLKHLVEKGVLVVERVKGETVKKGLSDFVSLFVLVQTEAEGMFGEKRPKLTVSRTNIGHYEDIDYVEFCFDEGNKKEQGYFVELWGPQEDYPVSIVLRTKSEHLEKLEGKRIILTKVPKNNDDFWSEDDGSVYLRRPLDSVFEKPTVQDQRQEIGRLLREIYENLEKVKEPVR